MVVRGLVEAISDNTHVKVRIPKINKSENAIGATPSSELATAVISTPPGYSPKIKRGDAVIVAFENDDESSPVILGLLFNPNNKTKADAVLDSLQVAVNAVLPVETTIGELSSDNIATLIGIRENIQIQLDRIVNNINDNTNKIYENSVNITSLQVGLQEAQSNIKTNATDIDKLQEGTYKVSSIAYGTEPATEHFQKLQVPPVEGQIYLHIQ